MRGNILSRGGKLYLSQGRGKNPLFLWGRERGSGFHLHKYLVADTDHFYFNVWFLWCEGDDGGRGGVDFCGRTLIYPTPCFHWPFSLQPLDKQKIKALSFTCAVNHITFICWPVRQKTNSSECLDNICERWVPLPGINYIYTIMGTISLWSK